MKMKLTAHLPILTEKTYNNINKFYYLKISMTGEGNPLMIGTSQKDPGLRNEHNSIPFFGSPQRVT